MPQGRPTKFNQDMQDLAEHYIDHHKTEYDDEIPSAVGMCLVLKVNESTLYEWAKDPDKNFSKTLDRCRAKQQQVLFNKGLTNQFNATIVKLALANHGYSEKTENTLQGPGGGPIEVDTTWEVTVVEANPEET